ncbi:Subtilisin-like protease 9 [Beauveria bassiana]|nr:Subtilisin-like protease 9 [Beauveria bassiana]
MKLLLSHLAVAVAIVQIGHALPQASKDGDAVGHIVVLKGNLSEAHLNEHLDAVKGIQRRSKRDGSGETGVKHVVDGASYGFQGYTGVFTPETLEYIKAHEHVDYVEEDSIISEPPVESREVSAADLVPVDESADTDTANVAKGSAGGLTRQKSTIGGTLSWGQGYSTLLGKGLRLDVVVSLSVKTKRNNPTVLNETDPATAFNFTAPSADMTGVNLDEYFAEPDPDTIFDDIPDAPETSEQSAKANGKRAVAEIPGCTGRINTHYKFAEDYDSYMHALDMSNDALTFVATIEVEKQQDFENGRFHAESYLPAQFHQTHGDKWVKGYRRGGKLMARLIFRAKESSNTTEVKAYAEAALRSWGVSGDVSVSVKDSMEQVDEHAHVDITMFQEGNLGTFMTGSGSAVSSDQSTISSASGSFKQVKEWADQFMQQACNHNSAYRPVLEEYTTLPGFPADQRVHDYGTARIMSNRVLRELVKLSELVTTVTRRLENEEGWEEHIDNMSFDFWDIVAASKKWVEVAADEPTTARTSAKGLMVRFRLFNRTYKRYLCPLPHPDTFYTYWSNQEGGYCTNDHLVRVGG